jgi:hypothetical protein
MIDLKELAKEIHENAVAHGWWDEPRSIGEIIALIHSEWSEALEEYRNGRPMVCTHECVVQYYGHVDGDQIDADICENHTECNNAGRECANRCTKPCGIAVELIDGCIRIIDFLTYKGYALNMPYDYDDETMERDVGKPLPEFVTELHFVTTGAYDLWEYENLEEEALSVLEHCIVMISEWLNHRGIDPYAVLLEKHEYNKTREYRHGGKLC